MLWIFVRSTSPFGQVILTNVHKICSLEQEDPLFPLILSLLGCFIQRQIVYNVKMLENKHCCLKEGPLNISYVIS